MFDLIVMFLVGCLVGWLARGRRTPANNYAASGPRTFDVSSYAMGETLRRAAARKGGT